MKYKVGDKVKVREGLELDKYYDGIECSEFMLKLRGKEVTISSVVPSEDRQNPNIHEYHILEIEDNQYYFWTEEMLEPIEPAYPKEMLVWNNNESEAEKKEIVAYAPQLEYPYLRLLYGAERLYVGYKYAKDIKPKQIELTLEDIAEKFGVSVDNIKIKK